MKQLFHRPYFRVTVVSDVTTVELCGALKVHSTYILIVSFPGFPIFFSVYEKIRGGGPGTPNHVGYVTP